MNAQQRKFLIEKIQEKTKKKIEELQKGLEKAPSASNYLFKAALNGTLELQQNSVILEAVKEKALRAKEGDNWLSEQSHGWGKESSVKLGITDLFVLPADYYAELERVRNHNASINEEVGTLRMQLETVEMRVQLASDKTLQRLINEVDDMGELSLIDSKIKLLN